MEHDVFMDKLKDGVNTDSKQFIQYKDAVYAVIAMFVFVLIMIVLLLFG